MSRVLVISYSDLARDSRVDRQIGFLRRRHEVVAAGLGAPAYEDVDFVDVRPPAGAPGGDWRSRTGLLLHRYQAAYWARAQNRIALSRLEGCPFDAVLANDLSSLPLACRIAGRAPVIFDAHEMAAAEWSHVWWWNLLIAPYVDTLLRTYLPRVDATMTVSDGIAELYERRYGVRPTVVTNACAPAALAPTPVHTPIRMITHGAADPQRRLELMIEATARLTGAYSLDLMLMPTDQRYMRHLRSICASHPRARLIEPRPQRTVAAFCNDYDIGVYLLPPLNENNLHALPNKLFEFVQARLAIAVGPSAEMAKLVKARHLGVVADAFTPHALARAIETLTPERIDAYKQRAHAAAGELNAERNAEIVLDLVDGVLARTGAR